MIKTTIEVAQNDLAALVVRAEAGEEVLILRDTVPVARLVAFASPAKARVFGALAGQIEITPAFFDPLPQAEVDGWDRPISEMRGFLEGMSSEVPREDR